MINDYTVVEERLLSEGGYAYIFQVHDWADPSKKYALKKIRIGVRLFSH